MRWPVVLIGAVLISSVIIFAVSYGDPKDEAPHLALPAASSSLALFGSSTGSFFSGTSGVEGFVRVRCLTEKSDPACAPQIRTIEAYQGVSSVGLFKSDLDGRFRGELPGGHYELRVSAADSTKCVSVGVVVPVRGFIATNISCEAGGL
jgi:hypothetical protein